MNILCICAHPDDMEVNCAGTLLKYRQQGHNIFLALTTYFYFTGTMLGNLAPLLTVPGLLGLAVVILVSWRTTGKPFFTDDSTALGQWVKQIVEE